MTIYGYNLSLMVVLALTLITSPTLDALVREKAEKEAGLALTLNLTRNLRQQKRDAWQLV